MHPLPYMSREGIHSTSDQAKADPLPRVEKAFTPAFIPQPPFPFLYIHLCSKLPHLTFQPPNFNNINLKVYTEESYCLKSYLFRWRWIVWRCTWPAWAGVGAKLKKSINHIRWQGGGTWDDDVDCWAWSGSSGAQRSSNEAFARLIFWICQTRPNLSLSNLTKNWDWKINMYYTQTQPKWLQTLRRHCNLAGESPPRAGGAHARHLIGGLWRCWSS